MMRTMFKLSSGAALVLVTLTGCNAEGMSSLEALDALGEVNRSSRGEVAVGDVIEVSTDVTIGDRVEAAAETIAAFWESQAPCSTVTVEGAKVTIDYGSLQDNCTFDGATYAGVTTHEVVSTERGSLEVLHDYAGFTNGDVTVDGDATVTWTGEDATRRVETVHTWTDGEGHIVEVTGDHVQGPLDVDEDGPAWAGWIGGITMEGTRDWTHVGDDQDGDVWALDMQGLELRWVDPAPQAGVVTVTNPDGKDLTITYSRVDDTTIQAVLSGLRRGDKTVHINLVGGVEEVD